MRVLGSPGVDIYARKYGVDTCLGSSWRQARRFAALESGRPVFHLLIRQTHVILGVSARDIVFLVDISAVVDEDRGGASHHIVRVLYGPLYLLFCRSCVLNMKGSWL